VIVQGNTRLKSTYIKLLNLRKHCPLAKVPFVIFNGYKDIVPIIRECSLLFRVPVIDVAGKIGIESLCIPPKGKPKIALEFIRQT